MGGTRGSEDVRGAKLAGSSRRVTFTQWGTSTLSGWHGCHMTARRRQLSARNLRTSGKLRGMAVRTGARGWVPD